MSIQILQHPGRKGLFVGVCKPADVHPLQAIVIDEVPVLLHVLRVSELDVRRRGLVPRKSPGIDSIRFPVASGLGRLLSGNVGAWLLY